MTKVKPTTQEQLIHYLVNNISLGTYDNRFLSNLLAQNITSKKPVTSNQNNLLQKIVQRYRRQLTKQELVVEELIKLPWTVPVIKSLPQYTEARVTVEDGKLILRSPYKAAFIKELKQNSFFKWDRVKRIWESIYCEYTLNTLTSLVQTHYSAVVYDEQIKQDIQELTSYENMKYWNPTLVKRNGSYFIYAANEQLLDSIGHLPLDVDVLTLSRLVSYGIDIDKDLIQDLKSTMTLEKIKEFEFATNVNIPIEVDELNCLPKLLASIQCEAVFVNKVYNLRKDVMDSVLAKISEANIKVYLRNSAQIEALEDSNLYSVTLTMGYSGFPSSPSKTTDKTITVVNSSPVKF